MFTSLINFLIQLESPNRGQIYFTAPATDTAMAIFTLHDDIMFILVIICCFVLWVILFTLKNFQASKNWKNEYKNIYSFHYLHRFYALIEIAWTIVPALIVLSIAYPSLTLLYSLEKHDDSQDSKVTLKAIGHQWYWEYEMSTQFLWSDGGSEPVPVEFNNKFDSYMADVETVMQRFSFRLLETDEIVYLPVNTYIRLVVTSADVLHCWTIPAFGVKLDACPGRINVTNFICNRMGNFYGQCSEICGVNHGFMPIHVRVTSYDVWKRSLWMKDEFYEGVEL